MENGNEDAMMELNENICIESLEAKFPMKINLESHTARMLLTRRMTCIHFTQNTLGQKIWHSQKEFKSRY